VDGIEWAAFGTPEDPARLQIFPFTLCLEFAEPVGFSVLVALAHQLGTDRFGESPDVPATDRNVGQEAERSGGQLERRKHGAGVDDLGQHRRAVPVGIKFEMGSLGGKNPGDRRGCGRWALGP